MKTAPVMPAGPTDDVSRADGATRAAFAEAIGRSAELWRRIDNPSAPVPGLAWNVGQTAAHVVGDLSEYTEALSSHVNGRDVSSELPDERPWRLRTAVNAHHLTVVPERDPRRLADMLEQTAVRYLAAAATVDASDPPAIATADGLVLEPALMTCLLLGEQLVHGLDIARAAHQPWSIRREDALLVLPAVLALAPKYLRPDRSRGVQVSFELRLRAGPATG